VNIIFVITHILEITAFSLKKEIGFLINISTHRRPKESIINIPTSKYFWKQERERDNTIFKKRYESSL